MEVVKLKVGTQQQGRSFYKTDCIHCGKSIQRGKYKVDKYGWSKLCRSCSMKSAQAIVQARKEPTKNENYFSERSLQSCYWAGFIAADGCIREDRLVQIGLHKKDRCILEQLIEDADLKEGITEYKDTVVRAVYSKQWVKNLAEIYNITPRKSKTLQPPNLTNEDEIKAFIIGYIDGDGSIGTRKATQKQGNNFYTYEFVVLRILGTQEMIEWIKYWFSKWYPTKRQYKGTIKRQGCIELRISGTRAEQILKMLKNIPVKKLARKWDRVI